MQRLRRWEYKTNNWEDNYLSWRFLASLRRDGKKVLILFLPVYYFKYIIQIIQCIVAGVDNRLISAPSSWLSSSNTPRHRNHPLVRYSYFSKVVLIKPSQGRSSSVPEASSSHDAVSENEGSVKPVANRSLGLSLDKIQTEFHPQTLVTVGQ